MSEIGTILAAIHSFINLEKIMIQAPPFIAMEGRN